tara:strand:- start:13087 stop:13278 length:192 start_codon:yes stop_codon:yes gene_type:complete
MGFGGCIVKHDDEAILMETWRNVSNDPNWYTDMFVFTGREYEEVEYEILDSSILNFVGLDDDE